MTNSLAYRDIFYKWLWVSRHLTIINHAQSWEGVVSPPTAPSFLSELLLLHFQWPVSSTYQEIPIFLAKYPLISNFSAWHWSYRSYYSCIGWNDVSEHGTKSGGFLILTELLFDTTMMIVIFILLYNSFGTYLFVLILWFFKGFLEEGASGFKCKRAKKSMKMNSISIYIHQSISLELKTSKNLNIYFKGMFYISVICF